MRLRFIALLACVLGLAWWTPTLAATPAIRYTFPAADVVFPEGIGAHPSNGTFFVGSTANGAVYRGDTRHRNRSLVLFSPGGSDGRTDVRGIKVDTRGFLWLAGGATGTMWMYDSSNGRLLSSFANGVQNSFINDVAIAPDGSAYFLSLIHI